MVKRNFNFIASLAMIFTLSALISCDLYPDSDARVEELDMVFSHYDRETDFSQLRSYGIVDEVYLVNGDTTDPEVADNSDYILDLIKQNMQAFGYEEVENGDSPDVRMTVTASAETNYYYYSYYYYYDYFYYYWWGYYPGGGWYYPYYPYYPVYMGSYTIGTLLMDMVDFRNNTGVGRDSLNVLWSGICTGLLEGSPSSLLPRIKDGIDQAFEQSPYLNLR